ncbi:hypothetical protein AB0J52_10080 [Spirillospora sp. NPDC049652]
MPLRPPDALWAHGALLAACGNGFALDGEGVCSEDIGNGWWRLFWVEGGRAVLLGFDNDYSDTFTQAPPLDLLADAPDWLPWERVDARLHGDWPVGFVYWWDGEDWARTSYTCEDGAALTVPDDDERVREALGDAAPELLAAARRGELPTGADAAGIEGFDVAVAGRAGLTRGSVRPEVPAGTGAPADRKVPWDGLEENHATIVGLAMRRARERPRAVPADGEALGRVVEWLRTHGQDEIVAGYVGDWHPPFREPQGPFVKTDLAELLAALRAHEADPESGAWLYIRVTAEGDASRAYDSMPEWWRPTIPHTWAWPKALEGELASRAEPWRPAWAWLLDASVLKDGISVDLLA